MRGMMRTPEIRVGMRGIKVGLMGMRGIRMGMMGMRGIRVGMRGIRLIIMGWESPYRSEIDEL